MTAPAIVWFRDDLRLADNPALYAAAGRPVIALFVQDEESDGLRPLGGAARWWLHGALGALDEALRARGGRLLILHGAAAATIERLAVEIGAGAVYWNRRYGPAERRVDAGVKSALKSRGIAAQSFNGQLLREPWTVATQSGAPYRIFTAYWRAARKQDDPLRPLAAPDALDFHPVPQRAAAHAIDLADLALEPLAPDWAAGLRAVWRRGEAAGRSRLEDFLSSGLSNYAAARDRMGVAGTSLLSPYLRFGNLSARQVWHAATAVSLAQAERIDGRHLDTFLAELGWREFWYHLLYHEPDLAQRNLRPAFDAMPWRHDPQGLHAWQHGLTGYPIVDAGMRQLWTTGWMHNRVRMIAASFLVKDLLIDWRAGEAWFWDTLVDADPASNPGNWQWVTGSGTDAAPYFRIFNPTLQGEKFDPEGDYVRRWIPELAHLPASLIHRPWTAGAEPLAGAVASGAKPHPPPIVEHDAAGRRALEAWRAIGRDL